MHPRNHETPRSRTRLSRPTITEVAAEAGVAVATVSGILNERPDCRTAPATRERVLDVVRKLGYRPSFMAHALHGKATKTLGLIVPGIGVMEVTNRTIGSFEMAARRGRNLTVTACTRNDPALEDEAISELLDRHVDALAVHPTEHGPHTRLRQLAADGFPVVTLDGAGRLDFPVDDVSIDQFEGGKLQARHLIEIGRTRICIVNVADRCYVNDQKIAGLRAALQEAGCAEPALMNLSLHSFTFGQGELREFEAIGRFFQEHAGEFDAFAALGDMLALACIRIALQRGTQVPEDLAVIGFNDISVAEHVVPSLSTIHDPAEQLGETAFQLLEERLNGKRDADEFRQMKLLPELRARESTMGRRRQEKGQSLIDQPSTN